MKTPGIVAIALASAAGGAAASGWASHSPRMPILSSAVLTNTGYSGPAAVPLGDQAGATSAQGALTMANPLGDSPETVAEGKRLFRAMNCAGCHGYDGGGGMGPQLTDDYWRYGGAPAQVYKSIFEGRPQGMPAWGVALPPDQIWELTAYVESLGGGIKPANAGAARIGDSLTGATAKSGSGALEGQ